MGWHTFCSFVLFKFKSKVCELPKWVFKKKKNPQSPEASQLKKSSLWGFAVSQRVYGGHIYCCSCPLSRVTKYPQYDSRRQLTSSTTDCEILRSFIHLTTWKPTGERGQARTKRHFTTTFNLKSWQHRLLGDPIYKPKSEGLCEWFYFIICSACTDCVIQGENQSLGFEKVLSAGHFGSRL